MPRSWWTVSFPKNITWLKEIAAFSRLGGGLAVWQSSIDWGGVVLWIPAGTPHVNYNKYLKTC